MRLPQPVAVPAAGAEGVDAQRSSCTRWTTTLGRTAESRRQCDGGGTAEERTP
jgi:hypothetical protein